MPIVTNLMVRAVLEDIMEESGTMKTAQEVSDILLASPDDETIFLDGWKDHIDMTPHDINNMPEEEEE